MITVVTAITGKRDRLLPQPDYDGVRYVAFIDEPVEDEQWEVRKACDKFRDAAMNAKIHKVLAHKYVDAPYIVWLDGNRCLTRDPFDLIELMAEKDLGVFEHYGRNCIYKEILTCLKVRKGNPDELLEQKAEYERRGYAVQVGLYECSAFIRRTTPSANLLFERWWAEICRYSARDQVCFPVVFAKEDLAIIPGKLFRGTNDFFSYEPHHG